MKVTRALGRIGGIFLPFRNFKKMVGWQQLKENYQNVGMSAIEVLRHKKSENVIKESFDEAVRRLNLTPEKLESRKKTLFWTAILYSVIGVGLFAYAVKLLLSGMFLATLIALILVVIALALAYREHFWYVQMKHQRLGISFKDWFGYTFRGIKK